MKKINNTLRIIGGTYRGKKITFPSIEGLRPTPDRVRETLFNWLMHDIRGACCLDLFAGSGALGFEALSRGAAEVVLVEKNPIAYHALQQTAATLRPEQITIQHQSALDFLQTHSPYQFDIVFIDPPFAAMELFDCIHAFEQRHLKNQGLLYVEAPHALPLNPNYWQNLKLKTAGQITYGLYQKIGNDIRLFE